MYIMVTGGSGFIGANLCRRLLAAGHRVLCVDNNYTGSYDNIQPLVDNERFAFVEHDVCVPFADWPQLSGAENKLDQIYNLACPASPPAYQGVHSIETTKTCVLGAINVLDLALKHDATVLQASTSEVYGDPLVSPQSEDYRGNVNPNGIRSCYDEGKRCAESLFFDYARHKGAKVKVIRIFNTYGPFMDPNDGRVVSNFICQALQGQDLTVYGRGQQTRSFCFIDDLVSGMTLMMNSDPHFQGPVNLGNPHEFTILELASKVLELIPNCQSRLIYKDLPLDDPQRRRPDITLAKSRLRWEPRVPLVEGLKLSIPYFVQKLRARGLTLAADL